MGLVVMLVKADAAGSLSTGDDEQLGVLFMSAGTFDLGGRGGGTLLLLLASGFLLMK